MEETRRNDDEAAFFDFMAAFVSTPGPGSLPSHSMGMSMDDPPPPGYSSSGGSVPENGAALSEVRSTLTELPPAMNPAPVTPPDARPTAEPLVPIVPVIRRLPPEDYPEERKWWLHYESQKKTPKKPAGARGSKAPRGARGSEAPKEPRVHKILTPIIFLSPRLLVNLRIVLDRPTLPSNNAKEKVSNKVPAPVDHETSRVEQLQDGTFKYTVKLKPVPGFETASKVHDKNKTQEVFIYEGEQQLETPYEGGYLS